MIYPFFFLKNDSDIFAQTFPNINPTQSKKIFDILEAQKFDKGHLLVVSRTEKQDNILAYIRHHLMQPMATQQPALERTDSILRVMGLGPRLMLKIILLVTKYEYARCEK